MSFHVVWRSDIDGDLGNSVPIALETVSTYSYSGMHLISLHAYDDQDLSCSDSISFDVDMKLSSCGRIRIH